MKIKAGYYKFQGRQPSLGYLPGQVYFLVFREDNIYPVQINFPYACPYSSCRAFLDNWEPIYE